MRVSLVVLTTLGPPTAASWTAISKSEHSALDLGGDMYA